MMPMERAESKMHDVLAVLSLASRREAMYEAASTLSAYVNRCMETGMAELWSGALGALRALLNSCPFLELEETSAEDGYIMHVRVVRKDD